MARSRFIGAFVYLSVFFTVFMGDFANYVVSTEFGVCYYSGRKLGGKKNNKRSNSFVFFGNFEILLLFLDRSEDFSVV